MTYRVIQWATGGMGRDMLQQVIDHPDLELVGVRVFSNAKAGLDAGEIADRPATGVVATTDTDEILALDADVVLHTPLYLFDREPADRDVIALLESGMNVISNTAGFFYPPATPGERTERLAAACRAGGATLYATGIQPSVLTAQVAPTLTSLCSAVRAIKFSEFWEFRDDPRPEFVFDVIGYGKRPEENEDSSDRSDSYLEKYVETFSLTARQLGCEVVGISRGSEVRLADEDFEIAAGRVGKGTVSSILRYVELETTGPRIRFQTIRTVEPAPEAPWELRKSHRIEIDGDPPLRVDIDIDHDFGTRRGESAAYTPLTRAICSPVILSIPEVVAAPPGILRAHVFAPWRARLAPPEQPPFVLRP